MNGPQALANTGLLVQGLQRCVQSCSPQPLTQPPLQEMAQKSSQAASTEPQASRKMFRTAWTPETQNITLPIHT